MVRILCCLCFLAAARPALAQNPTPANIQAQMAEAIRGLKQEIATLEQRLKEARLAKEDPSTIKQLEEQLALLRRQVAMMESQGRQLTRMPAAALEQVAAEEPGKAELPRRDQRRIAAIPDRTFTEAELVSFVKTIATEVERLLPAKERAEALKIHAGLKAEKHSADHVANVATSLWLGGYPELAVLLQGKEAAADPSNINNLNNLAAFLTMAGGEHAAIPILQSLDARFPDNSTILNNLGQAWFGLGDATRAEQYLDRALAAYPRHAQANLTISRIQAARGQTAEAIQSVKRAIEEHYTADKEQAVTDLGGSVSFEDIPFPYPRPRGPWPPLGVEKFWNAIPPYPFTAADADLNHTRWYEFRRELTLLRGRLQPEIDALWEKSQAVNQQFMADPRLLLPYNNPVHNTAMRKRAALVEWWQDRQSGLQQRFAGGFAQIEAGRRDLEAVLRNPDASCGAKAGAALNFMQQANTIYRDYNTAFVDLLQQYTGAMVTLSMYASNAPVEYEWMLAVQKSHILSYLGGLSYAYAPVCAAPTAEEAPQRPLPDFDEANCDHKDEIFIPPFTTIRTECNKMSTAFDINTETGVKVKLGWEENLNSGRLTRGTLELGYEQGLTPQNLKHLGGPFSGEMKVEGALGMEVTPEGVKEVYVKAKASAKMTGQVEGGVMKAKSSTVGSLEMKTSWNAGAGSNSYVGSSGKAAFSAISWTSPQIQSR